ncbi:phage portal protein [bacterium]|nr:MAG: phage portal protein [bacterium]
MILSRALTTPKIVDQSLTLPQVVELVGGGRTTSGESVSPENSKTIASAYRAGNILSDDVAKLPFQQFRRNGDQVEQVQPDGFMRNIPYLLEVSPNLWFWTPFQFKKTVIQWEIYHGNAYIWRPAVWPPQLLILPADVTYPVLDKTDGSLWYCTRFNNGQIKYIPSVEILHLLINPDRDGFYGRGVIQYARETIGRQLGAHKTQAKFFGQGLNPAGYISVTGTLDKEGRKTIRESYEDAMSSSENAYRLAVFDQRVVKFETVTMKPSDAQFLESIQATDLDIANFFGIPLYKLNSGKQSYQSNEQQNLDYLSTSLDPFLVQFEQGARIKWLSLAEQGSNTFKFIREALLRTDALTRAQMNEILIRSGQRSPNEAREKDDLSNYDGGDEYYMSANYAGTNMAAPTNAPTGNK